MEHNNKVVEFLGDPDKTMVWVTGKPSEITGFSLKDREGDWLLVVKRQHKGKAEVAFCSAESPFDCFDYFLAAIEKRDGIRWQEDKWARLAK